jgi:hypothetical protein
LRKIHEFAAFWPHEASKILKIIILTALKTTFNIENQYYGGTTETARGGELTLAQHCKLQCPEEQSNPY